MRIYTTGEENPPPTGEGLGDLEKYLRACPCSPRLCTVPVGKGGAEGRRKKKEEARQGKREPEEERERGEEGGHLLT